MLLVIDIGNTNITFGVYKGEVLLHTFRMTTKASRTPDELGINIYRFLKFYELDVSQVKSVIMASVVPDLNGPICMRIEKFLGLKTLVVGPGTKTGIKIRVANPQEIGADRITDEVGAYELYGGPVLVIDFGTATTYDLVTEDGAYIAGITAPGIRGSASSLWATTAQLPVFDIVKPASILAKETVSSLQAGLVYGYIGSVEYIIREVKRESGYEDLKVVATGGLGKIIYDATDEIQIYDPDLTLKGLRLIYEKNV